MLDFGLSRQYTTLTGEVRQPRAVAGFRGTVRYASLNAHLAKDLGRHDDLWSVFYMLVELAVGQLPWRRIRDKEEAGTMKAQYDHKKLIKTMPYEFYNFLSHLKDLTYSQKPDYAMLINMLKSSIKRLGILDSDPYDWEQDYSAPSLTTASVGSPPAVKIVEEGSKKPLAVDGVDGKVNAPSSKTNCSEVADLSDNVGQRPPPVKPSSQSPTPPDEDAKTSDKMKVVINSDNRGGSDEETSPSNKQLISRPSDEREEPDGHEKNVQELTGVEIPNQPVNAAQIQVEKKVQEDGLGVSEVLEIENRYESEGDTSSSTATSTESREENQNDKLDIVDMLESNSNLPQPNFPLHYVESECEPFHRYGSITPMKSIHTDSLNRFFDIGVQQHAGSSETIANRFTQAQPREQEKGSHSINSRKEKDAMHIATSSVSNSTSSHAQYQEDCIVEIHPEQDHRPKLAYSSHTDSVNDESNQLSSAERSKDSNQPSPATRPAEMLAINDYDRVRSSADREEMELQTSRVTRMISGLHDSDSSRSVQAAATTAALGLNKKNGVLQEDTSTNSHPPCHGSLLNSNPDASTNKNNDCERDSLTTPKATAAQHLTKPDSNVATVSSSSVAKVPPLNARGGGKRKLPATPSVKTDVPVSMTNSPQPPTPALLQHHNPSSLSNANLPQSVHTPHLSSSKDEADGKQNNDEVLSHMPRPPPNPPPANYTANLLARRRRFIRTQQK